MEDSIFTFNDKEALQVQDNDTCAALYQDFWTRLDNAEDLPDLSLAKQSVSQLHWLARYASVVVVRPLDSHHSCLSMVGLDRWEHVVHASIHGRESTAEPDVTKPAFFGVGRVVTNEVDELLQQFDQALSASEANNTGNMRGQHGGHRGNQKTPSFARAVLLETMLALSGVSDTPMVQGGTTDVGLHTGSILRNTSFPLVLSLFHELLKKQGESGDETFLKCVSTYFLSYLEDVGNRITEYDERPFDRVITIIREIETFLPGVEDTAFQENVVATINDLRSRLNGLRPGENAQSRPLQLDESVSDICRKLRAPKFPSIPDPTGTQDPASKMEQSKCDAKDNLKYSNILIEKFSGKLQDSCVQIAGLNQFFWRTAIGLEDKVQVNEISQLREKLALFGSHISLARGKAKKVPLVMTAVLSSEELLAHWICCCRAHRAAENQHSLFEQFGTALDQADLQHIAVSDTRAKAAVESVRRFLKSRKKSCRRPFRKKDDTLAFAEEFGLQWSLHGSFYRTELQEAKELIKKRERKILKTQSALSVLDCKMVDAKQDLANAQRRFNESESREFDYDRNDRKVYRNLYYEYQEERDTRQSDVDNLQHQIKQLEIKPRNLLLGLPRSEAIAARWLFFIFMPKEFRDLSALCQSAQSKLWKQPPQAGEPTLNLLTWFRSHRKATTENGNEAELRLGSNSSPPRISTPNIRRYGRETGVQYPDSFPIDPIWSGTNPFAPGRTSIETTVLFTENLPLGVHQRDWMQKFVPMLPTPKRENESIARRDLKPEWLTQEQYVAFANLRAGPFAQIRSLTEALRDDLLPFQHPGVHVLVKQLLFHVGDGWNVDLDAEWTGFARIASELRRHCDLLRHSPKDCDRLLLFGVMSSFYGQDSEKCEVCARDFAKISWQWVDDVGREVIRSDQMSPGIYWKQAKFYGYALLCYSFGELEDSEYLDMAKLMILFRSKAMFSSDVAGSDALNYPILQVMASRMECILAAISRSLGFLTEVLSLVLDDAPSTLQWSPVVYGSERETACFEAEFGDFLYSINLLNGTVLVDGVPPGLLPASVVENPLYQRTFESRIFEMVVLGTRHYRTARLVDDQFMYEFVIDDSKRLHIFEQDMSTGEKLLLLRKDDTSFDLPPLLLEKHSHWYSERHKIVVLRNPIYFERSVEFVVASKATHCLLTQHTKLSLEEIVKALPDCDRLLLGSTRMSKKLEHFERPDYTHVTVDPDEKVVQFSLPRYRLSFSLCNQTLCNQTVSSAEFKGFCMNDSRVLEDTLPRLKACIVLSHVDGREKVLIPEGKIVDQALIDVPHDWRATLSFHIYNVHARFRHLIAGTTAGRLHLAGIYASSACAVSERRTRKPGAGIACELVRQSWKNEPLDDIELSKLIEVSSHSNLSCTLRLLCSWLWTSSNSVAFLHKFDAIDRHPELELNAMALEEYNRSVYSPRLMPGEELFLLGWRPPAQVPPPFLTVPKSQQLFATFVVLNATFVASLSRRSRQVCRVLSP
jgi:hypothetical protein